MTPPISATIERMSDIPPVVADCDRAFAAVQRLVDNVQADQWTAPTPCTEWNVRQLVHHIANGNVDLRRPSPSGERPSGPITQEERAIDRLGDDPAAGFRATGQLMHDAFSAPGFLEAVFDTPMMGEAAGSDHRPHAHQRVARPRLGSRPRDRAAGGLPRGAGRGRADASGRQRLGDRPRDEHAVRRTGPVPDDAPAIDRLAAFLGRQP